MVFHFKRGLRESFGYIIDPVEREMMWHESYANFAHNLIPTGPFLEFSYWTICIFAIFSSHVPCYLCGYIIDPVEIVQTSSMPTKGTLGLLVSCSAECTTTCIMCIIAPIQLNCN